MLLYINSFLDRTVITLVIDPIKADFGVSDTGVSLLTGLAFALIYSVLGIPMGRLADRRSRRWIIGIGATGWAAMASLCGITQNYAQLFLARMGLGVGEATFMPSAFSMISDYFSRQSLPRAYAVLMLGAPLGSASHLSLVGSSPIMRNRSAPWRYHSSVPFGPGKSCF